MYLDLRAAFKGIDFFNWGFFLFWFFLGQVKVFRALYTFEPRTVSTSRLQWFENLNLNLVYNISSLLLVLAC